MGLKKSNYEIEDLGITVPSAYAQITSISVNTESYAYATFTIQKNRDAIQDMSPYDMVMYECKIDKSLPLYEQVYQKAKEDIFSDWEDDIVEVK